MNRPEIEPNFAGVMLRRAALNPERSALEFEGREMLYGEFADRVRRQAQLLRDAGVCVGDRVGYLGFNHRLCSRHCSQRKRWAPFSCR